MRKFAFTVAFLAVAMFCTALPITAQQSNDTVVVEEDDLTPDQLAKIQQKQVEDSIDQRIAHYGKWVGLGKEVGVAVDSSLSAITNQADHFSQTGVGKITIALVIWKVLGDQAVHILAGGVEFLIFLPIWVWSYRKFCMSHRVLIEKGPGFFGQKKWEVVAPFSDRGYSRSSCRIPRRELYGFIGPYWCFS